MRRLDPAPMSRGGLEAARTRFHWGEDARTLAEFLGRFTPFAPARGEAIAQAAGV
jgi:hypothetical protein